MPIVKSDALDARDPRLFEIIENECGEREKLLDREGLNVRS